MIVGKYTCKYQSHTCSTIVGTCSLNLRLLKGSGSGQSKQRVDGKDWLITLCNSWSNKTVPTGSHYIVNDEAELYEKIVSVKMLVIVIIVLERYSSTY